MFEAVVQMQGSASPASSAAAKKLERNKQRLSAAASAAELSRGAREEQAQGVPMTAAQRKLARAKATSGGGLGAGMRASLGAQGCRGLLGGWQARESTASLLHKRVCPPRPAPHLHSPMLPAAAALMAESSQAGGASAADAFELVGKPLRPGEEPEVRPLAAAYCCCCTPPGVRLQQNA